MDSVRIDKWLWSARFYKTRALASEACGLSRIESNGTPAKASRDIHPGDMLHIRTEAGLFHVEVLDLSDVRGPAPVAQALYRETDASKAARQALADERKANPQPEEFRVGKPTKRDRRDINKYRGR